MNDNKTILIIDDSVENLQSLSDCIEKIDTNFIVYRANNSKSAIEISLKKLPDTIITDWDMPEISGIELIKHLKSNSSTSNIPVIMCTGVMLTSENLKTALEAGAFDYIRKPIDKVELEARLTSALKYSEILKKLQNEKNLLTESEIKLKDANATKDRFFSILAHDLRNPFNTILGFSNLLKNNFNNYTHEKIFQYIERIYLSSENSHKLLENLLQWSRNQSGNIEFSPKTLSVDYIIKQSIDNTSYLARQKEITINYLSNNDFGINADINMISFILRNLITNAIKFTHRNGKIEISTFAQSNEVVIEIKDNGIGIEQSKIEKLFKISEKTSTKGTENEKGTGLGLILCKDFIEKHNGKISIESEIHKGSKFYISFPKISEK